MSYTSGHITLTAISDGDQVSLSLQSTVPLLQYLKAGTDSVSPDWTDVNEQPIVFPRAKSQNMGTRLTFVAGSEKWTYNDVAIVFDSNGLSSNKMFQKISYSDGGVSVPALRIVNNMASVTNTNNAVIGFSGTVISDENIDMSTTGDVRIEETVGDPYDGFISVTDGGIIDDDTDSIVCTAELRKGGAKVLTGVTYRWSKQSATGWVIVSSDSGVPHRLTVREGDIDTEAAYRCEFIVEGEVVAVYTRNLSDETDAFVVVVSVTGSTALRPGQTTTLIPTVMRRANQEEVTGFTFTFALYSANNTFIRSATASQLTLTYADILAAGKTMVVWVTAVK